MLLPSSLVNPSSALRNQVVSTQATSFTCQRNDVILAANQLLKKLTTNGPAEFIRHRIPD
jgi:hypothetical protein